MKNLIKLLKQKLYQAPLTTHLVKTNHPEIYAEIFKEGELSVHQKGLLADDLKHYPNGEELAAKVKSGEMTINKACSIALESQKEETRRQQEQVKNEPEEPKATIGFMVH